MPQYPIRMKGIILALSGLLLMGAPAAVQAQSGSGSNFNYSINPGNTNTITITKYTGTSTFVAIPTNINNLTVTSIGDRAFYFNGLTSVTIPGSVTNIGEEAFGSCLLLTAISADANNSCFMSVNGVLFDKSESTLLQYPMAVGGSYTIPGGVTSIGEWAFSDCFSLTNVSIPSTVTSIGNKAFSNCASLASITIPGSVSSIESSAFYACSSLTAVYFNGNAPSADSTVFVSTDFNYDPATAYYLAGTTGWDDFSADTDIPAVLWNPLIQTDDRSFGVVSNQYGFNITGTTNFTVLVEACTNLACPVWTPLTNVTLTNGSFYFSDPQWTNYSGRFYGLGFP